MRMDDQLRLNAALIYTVERKSKKQEKLLNRVYIILLNVETVECRI